MFDEGDDDRAVDTSSLLRVRNCLRTLHALIAAKDLKDLSPGRYKSSHISQQLATMSAELRTLTSYFAAFDGKKSWDEAKPYALNLAHPNITIHHGDKLQNYAEWLATVENFVKSGGSVDMLKFEAIEGGRQPLVRYTVRLNFADGTSSTASSTGTFQDGKLIRVEPGEGAQGTYDKLFGTAADPAQVATEQ